MSPSHSATEPFHDLVDESLDEAAFLWHRWEAELSSPTRNLDEVWSWTEDRLHGALDGVRVAGARLVDVATGGLQSDESDRVAVCAGLLASSTEPDAIEALTETLNIADAEKLRSIVRGLELLGSNHALRAAASVLTGRGPAGAGALCRLKAFRRVAPGDELASAFKSNVPEIQAAAVRAALHVPSLHAEEFITAALLMEDAAVRYAAAECGVCLGIGGAWEAATRVARQREDEAGPYLKLVAMLGTADEQETIYAVLPIPALQLSAIWALGHIGTARAAEACLAGMAYEKLARASGEAYCWITGADLVRDRLTKEETPPEVPAFEDDDLDANLVPAPEALWPLPDPEAARRHWLERRASFAPDVRHIHGRPATPETVAGMIEAAPMLRRPDLVTELRARTRGKYDVEPRAFAWQQRRMMALGRAALSGDGGR